MSNEDNEEKFRLWKQMILSDQMEHSEIVEFLKDHPTFANWYLKDIGDAISGDEL
jgi:hypothetical protein